MSRQCLISDKKANNAYQISHSHIRTKKVQYVNLQRKKIWSKSQSRWVKVYLSTKSMKKRYKINI